VPNETSPENSGSVIDLDYLANFLWEIAPSSNEKSPVIIRFNVDGEVLGPKEFFKHKWLVSNDTIFINSAHGNLIYSFDRCENTEFSCVFHGVYYQGDSHTPCSLHQQRSGLRQDLPFATKPRLKSNIERKGWVVGEHTYGGPTIYSHGPEKLIIGKYTSIGGGVVIVLVGHLPEYVSTYPFALHRKFWPSVPIGVVDQKGKGDIVIGNDVWIGHGATIMPGVKIGDGAIVGGQSVVTKDIPPYAIAVGNPARLVRYRFDDEVIKELLEIKWWLWSDEKVDKFLPLILSDDIKAFIAVAKSSGSSPTS
jgi:acetyltransferase-like isoleucine patch superfamily enzyme